MSTVPVEKIANRCGNVDHFVQFYETDSFLVESVATFLAEGLAHSEGAIVIATESHRVGIDKKLSALGIDVIRAKENGDYVPLDAAETLSKFIVEEVPNERRFKDVVGSIVERVSKTHSAGIRAFGEMVALLWAEGNGAAAIRLEELWNELGKRYEFSLFCAYPLNGFDSASNEESFSHICDTHSRVLPSERYLASSETLRLKQVALLQQKAAALQTEIDRRKAAEGTLRLREAELTEFVENASIGLHWVGPDGKILWANRTDFELLGYSKEEYIGRHIADFYADRCVIDDILSRLNRHEKIKDYEARLRCKDSSIKTVLIDSSVLWDNGRFIHTQCFTRDITEQKRVEGELRLSSRLLAENSAPVLRVSREEILHFANPSAQRLLSECGARIGEPAPAAILELIGDGRRHDQEASIGEHCYTVAIVPVHDGEFTNLYFADITDRKRAEEKLRESEERYRQLVGLMPSAIYACDAEGRITFYNRRAVELWGREPNPDDSERFCACHKVFLMDGKYVPPHETPMAIAIRDGKRFRNVEATVERPDGSRFVATVNIDPVWDAEGKIRGAINVFEDITDQKRAQIAVQRLAAIVESSDDAIVSKDLNGIITSWNKGAERVFGYVADEVIGKPVTILIPPDRINEEPAILERLRRGERVDHFQTIRRRKDGTLLDISLTISPIKDSDGKVIGASKVARDITDLVRAKEKLEETVAERTVSLREAVEQMEEFSYSVSHDLRAPLRAMSAYAGVLLADYSQRLDETACGYLEKIRRSSDRMDSLTKDVLAYSRVARLQVQPEIIALGRLVEDVISQHANLHPPLVEIEVASPLPDVLGHEATLGQVVSNLLNNAVKFVHAGVKPHIRIYTERLGKNVRVWFEDNGIGIKPQHQQRIFQMFQRVHPESRYEGMGIGLTIVRKAIEKMGGKVGVESDGQNGSRFWIELPTVD